ncbi:ImuA family protein [Sphingomonas morindae]|uniref:Protein ImuA n=1 Tax=Sphingomonas morindae TaxID=1541170 RepID=A0ABY4XDT8_9SPHN|nr:hypothetical protein [Sphingomonas morindae]USI75014.1 protein ImuA [Sphingomonas morindae]
MSLSPASARLEALKAEIRALAPVGRGEGASLGFDLPEIDSRLAGGGLARAALHEVAGETVAIGDDAAATLFVAGLAARAAAAPVLWIMARPDLFAPGLAGAGLPAGRLIQIEAGRDADALAVMEDALRHGGAAAVVGEVTRIGMTATRRLQLAAEEGGALALLLRRWRRAAEDPLAEPSAAVTRWRIGCAPSVPLPVPGVGRACWRVALARQRGGAPHSWIVEGCDAQGRLARPAEPRDRSAAPLDDAARRAA